MSMMRYLNTVLTVLAILLALNLWTSWQQAPSESFVRPAHAQGLANAGKQRKQIIDQLKQVNVQLGELQKTLEEGKVRVKVQQPADKD